MPNNIDDVITWSFDVTYEKDVVIITMNVAQKNGWHIYSQVQPDGAIPLPTLFNYNTNGGAKLLGKTKEYGAELVDNEGFPERSFHGDHAKFEQKFKITSEKDFKIKIDYEYMACKTACLPPEFRDTEIVIKGLKSLGIEKSEEGDEGETNEGYVNPTQLDSALYAAVGNCEGTSYSDDFDPVKILVFDPVRTDEKDFSLSVEIQIDSVFAMYAFDNIKGYKSVFTVLDNEKLDSVQPFTTKISKIIGDDTKGYKYKIIISQDIHLKDTADLPIIKAELDLFLMGCENNFHSTKKSELSFKLKNSLDNKTRTEKDSLWIIFILAFGGGLLALLTPCVFPMIPMTVSFFTKQSKTKAQGIRKAIFYAVCIIVIYVILGVLVSSIAGEDALNAMATNPWVNLTFFLLFVVFAISFLGAFEITLPSSWVNKADKQADRGGLIGIFFMAFTLALVSFSCTGPIVGSVLVQSAQGGLSGPIIAMLGFSTALALPFGLFAAFPGWLNSMPSSGGWLNTVKVVLGFLELAFALKFLSNADLVLQLHILERELFLGIWIGIFIVLAIYLLGKIQMPHDSPVGKLSVGRALFATMVVGFIMYLIPGMFGAPLKMISGFPPPLTYSESPFGIHGHAPEVEDGWPESTYPHGHGIKTIRDYYEALAFAKEQGKPLFVDFTGWACVNCRKMEEYVWADPSIAPMLANDFIVASLYVDDRAPLPEKYAGELKANGDPMTTIGDKWTKLEITEYKEVTQPLYVILDHNENNISGKANYDTHRDAAVFKEWLEFAKKQFESSKDAKIIVPEFEVIK
ncbi:protein-disulfide reductase DsbD family protein [Crocinitomix catalasitica]|uniref:protein-disulfide reductase DsbD family protein n=1 Tax=Crocinitomix catalasitica TaxID=184607 RepID=UPI000B1D2EA5|nr:cytochrome c biogenesis protein CcdA [Crocinitomix catalasitica]